MAKSKKKHFRPTEEAALRQNNIPTNPNKIIGGLLKLTLEYREGDTKNTEKYNVRTYYLRVSALSTNYESINDEQTIINFFLDPIIIDFPTTYECGDSAPMLARRLWLLNGNHWELEYQDTDDHGVANSRIQSDPSGIVSVEFI